MAYTIFNTTVSISGGGINKIELASLTLTVFDFPDWLLNSWNSLNTPLNGAVGLIGGIIGIFGTLIARRFTNKKKSGKDESYSLTKIIELKKQGKLSDDDVLKAKNAILNNIGDAKSALSISIVDKFTKLAKLLDEGAISSEDFLKAKENLLNKIKDL